jgi:hypothetical protein
MVPDHTGRLHGLYMFYHGLSRSIPDRWSGISSVNVWKGIKYPLLTGHVTIVGKTRDLGFSSLIEGPDLVTSYDTQGNADHWALNTWYKVPTGHVDNSPTIFSSVG